MYKKEIKPYFKYVFLLVLHAFYSQYTYGSDILASSSFFYVGVNGGIQFLQQNCSLATPLGTALFGKKKSAHGLGNITLGYELAVGGILIAPELYGQVAFGSHAEKVGNNLHLESSQPLSGGVSVRFGVPFKVLSSYIKVGVDYAQFSYLYKEIVRNQLIFEHTHKAWKPGFAAGAGAERAVTSQLNLRVEYMWKTYGTVSCNFRDNTGDALAIKAKNLSSHTITVGALYRF